MAEEFKKDIIISVNTDTSGAEQGIDNLKKGLGEVNNTPVDKPFKTLKNEIKEASLEAQKMARQFGTDSQEFAKAAQRVAELKDEFQEVNVAVTAFNPDNKLQALASLAKGATGAIQGVSGAMAFLGVESDSAAETIAKLQGLMAFSDALNSIGDIKDSFKNFNTVISQSSFLQKANAVSTNLAAGAMRLLGISANTTGFAFKALRAAIIATGIGALVLGISTLLPIITNWISGTNDAEEAQNKLSQAVENLNHNLDINLEAIDRATKRQLNYAKIAGKTQEEMNAISKEGLNQRKEELKAASEEADRIYDEAVKTEGIKQEKLDEYRKQRETKYKQYVDSINAVSDYELETQADKAEEKRKQDKADADKAKSEAEKRASEAKSKREADAAKREAEFKAENEKLKNHYEEIKKITEQGEREAALAKLNDKDKEIAEVNNAYQDQLKAINDIYKEDVDILKKQLNLKQISFKDYNAKINQLNTDNEKANAVLTENKGIKELEITKKYNQIIADYINGYQQSEYEKSRAQLIKDFDDKIAVADEKQKVLLEKLKADELLELDDTERVRKDVLQKETNVINTQTDNRILETDDAETRKTKLQNVYNAEVEAEQSIFQQKLLSLKGNQDEIELATAEHNAKLKDMEYNLAEDRKAIDEAAKQAKLDNLSVLSGSLGKAGELFEQNSVANKAINVATATIDTYTGATKALAAYPPPFNYVAAAGVVASGLANVKKIVSTKVGKKDNTSGNASAPVTTAPTINSSVLNNQNQVQDVRITNPQQSVVKAYVSQRDLQNEQDKSNFLDKLNSF